MLTRRTPWILWSACLGFSVLVGAADAAQLTISAPRAGTVVAGTVSVSGNAAGYLNVEVHAAGRLLGRVTPAASGDYSVAIDTRLVADGSTTLLLDAWNSPAGRPFTLTQQTRVVLDVRNAANAAQLSLAAPQGGATVAGTVSFSGNARGFLNVEVSYAGAVLGRATPDGNGNFKIAAGTAGVPNGTRTLAVDAWNSPAGQPFSQHQRINRDLTIGNAAVAATPALSVADPSTGGQVSGAIAITGSAPGFKNVEVSYNGILLGRAAPAADGSFRIPVSTLSILDGAQTLTVDAWDAAPGQPSTQTRQSQVPLNVRNGCINIVTLGAVADGRTDNSATITRAIAAAQASGKSVCVPAGRFAFGSVLRLTGVKLFGVGNASVLQALNWGSEAIFMYGDGVEVRQLRLTGAIAPARQAAWESTHITLFGASHFVVDHVTIEGSAAAGIQTAQRTHDGTISNNSVTGTLADAIHLTDGASYITVDGNYVKGAGDDGVAVVSYVADGMASHHITARNNVVLDNVGGRAMSVVGGQDILCQNNLLQGDTAAACLYLAQEGSWNTFGNSNITADSNSMVNCGNPNIGHGAVMIVTTGSGQNSNISLRQNAITQNGNAGVRVFGANSNIVLSGNQVQGASPALDIQSAGVSLTPYVSGPVGYVAAPVAAIP